METIQELEALQEAARILQQARYATVGGASSVYAKVLHASKWVDQQVAALLAEPARYLMPAPCCWCGSAFDTDSLVDYQDAKAELEAHPDTELMCQHCIAVGSSMSETTKEYLARQEKQDTAEHFAGVEFNRAPTGIVPMVVGAVLYVSFFCALFTLSALYAHAHGGFVGKNGCHINSAEKRYECHKGPLSGKTFPNKEAADTALKTIQPDFTPSKTKAVK